MTADISHVLAERKEKFDAYKAWAEKHGKPVYPNDFRPSALAADLQAKYKDMDKEALAGNEDFYKVAGRVMFLRQFGKLAFLQLQDRTGRIQASISLDGVGEEAFGAFKEFIDMGDIVGVEGTPTRTNTGELTIQASAWHMLNKTLRPLPDKFHGLSDVEQRYRMRYVDLMMNDEARDTFRKRSQAVQAVRNFFGKQDFMEVETPMLQVQAGGAAARPFETHHNALDLDLTMRIAPELYLKRLVVGGFERVFEINRNFRNEGISIRHNPEFTMMEAYCAHMDYNGMMELTENMLEEVTQEVCGTTDITYGEHTISMKAPFKRLTMRDAIMTMGGADEGVFESLETIKAFAKEKGVEIDDKADYGHAFLELFEELCEEKLIEPTFITDYPKATSPLSRSDDADANFAQRAELFIVGRELGNLFSELNDPAEQAARFRDQVERASSGDDEAMPFDHDYVRALEYGLVPTAGLGIGIDRLAMLLTNSASIRDVIFFPTLRPEPVEDLIV